MFHPDTQFLIDRWIELARGPAIRGGVPGRARFRPETLGRRLPRAFLVDAVQAGPRFRLAGSWLESLHDRRLSGGPFLQIWCDASSALVLPAINQCIREARPVVVVAQLGPDPVQVEVALAPLRGPNGRPELVLGLVSPAGSLALAADDSRRLVARLAVGVGEPGRPGLRLVSDQTRTTAAASR